MNKFIRILPEISLCYQTEYTSIGLCLSNDILLWDEKFKYRGLMQGTEEEDSKVC